MGKKFPFLRTQISLAVLRLSLADAPWLLNLPNARPDVSRVLLFRGFRGFCAKSRIMTGNRIFSTD